MSRFEVIKEMKSGPYCVSATCEYCSNQILMNKVGFYYTKEFCGKGVCDTSGGFIAISNNLK